MIWPNPKELLLTPQRNGAKSRLEHVKPPEGQSRPLVRERLHIRPSWRGRWQPGPCQRGCHHGLFLSKVLYRTRWHWLSRPLDWHRRREGCPRPQHRRPTFCSPPRAGLGISSSAVPLVEGIIKTAAVNQGSRRMSPRRASPKGQLFITGHVRTWAFAGGGPRSLPPPHVLEGEL